MGFWRDLWDWLNEPLGSPPRAARPRAERPRAGRARRERDSDVEDEPESEPAAEPTWRKPSPAKTPRNPYAHSAVLDFDAQQVRKRFFELRRGGITPFFAPNAIPAPDDEFTALVDRAMVLGGYISDAELAEIHEVGDQWREHRDRVQHAHLEGKRSGQEAVAAFRAEREALKQERRAQAKAKLEARNVERQRRHAEDIVFLGRGVSARLGDRRSHPERLEKFDLPYLAEPRDLAAFLQITVPRLRWLCFHEEAATLSHYRQFEIPKRSGGMRTLAAPMPQLAQAQRWVLEHILEKFDVSPEAHGFVRGRSTVTNARPHVGQRLVINLDLENFFGTVTFWRVRGIFESVGYSPAVATLLGLLCTESPRRTVSYDGVKYHTAVGERALPQGACTSPALANRAATRLDRRLAGVSDNLGFTYTRYADDLTFSASGVAAASYSKLLGAVHRLVNEEGFRINPKKGRIQRRGGRQDVTGIVVNDQLGLPRSEVRKLRAILHQAQKTGLAAQNKHDIPNFRAWLEGKLAYLKMVDPEKGTRMLAELRALPDA